MDRSKVKSSNLDSVGYDEDKKVLEIEFNGGGVYQYFDVPVTVHENLMKAESAGKYFHVNIKGVYKFEKVDGPGLPVRKEMTPLEGIQEYRKMIIDTIPAEHEFWMIVSNYISYVDLYIKEQEQKNG